MRMSRTLERDAAPIHDLSGHVGYVYTHPDYYEISREVIRDFARAAQDFHPFHWDEEAARAAGHPTIMAPITFASAYGIRIHEHMYRELNYVPGPMVQSEQKFQYSRPIYAGDRLRCEVEITSFRSSLGADISETKNTATLWDTGEPVLVGWTKLAARTGAVMDENVAKLVDEVMMRGNYA
ncbi:MaoC domain protein dehydratase [Segniliparus rotundus DSM 44985]|uniref:MaoC domain protein dehydratase n=2 Tax=Segniliparus rotundus TaxID=286802 RepID=D6ZCX8_SEGRD|nr:MaoC domain protein dehydratase [Segniliparus rotundus DSM 44985]